MNSAEGSLRQVFLNIVVPYLLRDTRCLTIAHLRGRLRRLSKGVRDYIDAHCPHASHPLLEPALVASWIHGGERLPAIDMVL
jgi:hypothetical protein